MIETIVQTYLEDVLKVPCHMMRPEDPENTYVIIEKTGSERVNHIDTATIAVQTYAPTLYEAACLNESVKAAMEDIVELGAVAGVRLQTDYNFTNPATKQPRYQAVFNITHY